MNETRKAARALVVEDGKLLTFERWRKDQHGKWLHYLSIPGGGIEPGETPEEGVMRELQEEMGITVQPLAQIAVVRMPHQYRDHIHYFFSCKRVAGEPVFNLESEEAQGDEDNRYAVRWQPLDTLARPSFYFAYKPVVDALLPYLRSGDTPAEPLDIDISHLVE